MRHNAPHLALVVVLAVVGFVVALISTQHISGKAKAAPLKSVPTVALPTARPVIHGLASNVAALPSAPAQLPRKLVRVATVPRYQPPARRAYVPPRTAPPPKTTVIIPVPTQ